MQKRWNVVGCLVVLLAFAVSAVAELGTTPRLIKFSGAVKNATGTVGVTFALYKDQTGGAPLWLETQSVTFDANGRYTVYLGANHAHGLPLDLFASGEARWLGVQPEGQAELPRTLLVSVPYALAAGDAQTLGGKPLSAFVFAGQKNGVGDDGLNYISPAAITNAALAISAATTNSVPKFADSTGTLTGSAITDYNGFIGIGTNAPGRLLHLKGPNPNIRLEDTHFANSFWELQQSAYVDDWFGFLRYESNAAVPDKSLIISNSGAFGFGITNPYGNMSERVNIGPGNLRLWGTPGTDGIIFPDGSKLSSAVLTCPMGYTLNSTLANGTAVCSIPTAAAGSGITITNQGYPLVGADTAVLQKRVTGTCSSGSITAVNVDGSVKCSSGGGGPLIQTQNFTVALTDNCQYGNCSGTKTLTWDTPYTSADSYALTCSEVVGSDPVFYAHEVALTKAATGFTVVVSGTTSSAHPALNCIAVGN